MGGFGTWSLATKYPESWAAIVPGAAVAVIPQGAGLKDIPCWVFHGDADPAVPPVRSWG